MFLNASHDYKRDVHFRKNAHEGFSLIELVIVVGIIGILIAIAIPIYVNTTEKADTRACETNLRIIDAAINLAKLSDNPDDKILFSNNIFIGNTQDLVNQGYIKSPPPKCPSVNLDYLIVDGYAKCPRDPNPHHY